MTRSTLATGPGTGVDGLRLAGRQVTFLRAIHDHRLRRVLTFHHRVADARTFATTLPTRPASAAVSSSTSPPTPTPNSPPPRVLGEAIDVPSVDAVVFADPKNSPVDTVQAVGRALRQHPGARKKATLIIPVYRADTRRCMLGCWRRPGPRRCRCSQI
ncbi:helicase-related protein [Streptomyces sp. NPDC001820]|uniref:helicase-related protein n=1 Tax=Streptomyces sp. NPDC001820 TaxID=3364613 RepID=UPI0036884C57